MLTLEVFFTKLVKKGRPDLLHEDMHELAQEMSIPVCIDDFS